MHETSLWLSNKQDLVQISGHKVFEELNKTNALRRCLNLYHGLAIAHRGMPFLGRFLGGKNIFLWGSAVTDKEDGGIDVPYIYGDRDKNRVLVEYRCLDLDWTLNDPAIVFQNDL